MASKTRKKRPGVSGNPQKARAQVGPRPVRRAGVGDWIEGARLRTLPLAVSPVLSGTGAAPALATPLHSLLALRCLAVATLMHIGGNIANDYTDGGHITL